MKENIVSDVKITEAKLYLIAFEQFQEKNISNPSLPVRNKTSKKCEEFNINKKDNIITIILIHRSSISGS